MKQLKKKLELKKLFKLFDENNINYLVLKGYEDFENSNDIDLLIKKDPRLLNILRERGFFPKEIKEDFGVSKKDIHLHIRINGINYGGAILRNTKGIFDSRVKHEFFYILKKEDLFIHLILHAILNKKRFKESYIREIEGLINVINKQEVEKKLKDDFGKLGPKLMSMIELRNFKEALRLRKKLIIRIFTLRDFLKYILNGIIRRSFN
jgi:hypothetical protein